MKPIFPDCRKRQAFVPRLSGLALLVVGSILPIVVGCGPRNPATYPVSGTVALDGKPVHGAAVMFIPLGEGRPASGITNERGDFTMTTFVSNDGALPGKHAVTIALTALTGAHPDTSIDAGIVVGPSVLGQIKEKWIVPQKYSDPKTSGLSVDVQRGMAPLRFKLSSSEHP